jgi:catechol 2,3-dioxygenase-like lactoylglutathione lyase family enzyme
VVRSTLPSNRYKHSEKGITVMSYKLNTVMLYVSDMERAKAFYTGVLSATVLPDFESSDFALLQLPQSPALALFATRAGLPPGASAEPGGFELDLEVEDLEATYHEWQAQGVSLLTSIWDRGAIRLFYGSDPDGHLLAVYERVSQAHVREESRP